MEQNEKDFSKATLQENTISTEKFNVFWPVNYLWPVFSLPLTCPCRHTLHVAKKHLRLTHLCHCDLVAYFLCEKITPSEYIKRPSNFEGKKAWVGIKTQSSARSQLQPHWAHLWLEAGREAHPFRTQIKIMNQQREAPYITAFIMSTFKPLRKKALHVGKPHMVVSVLGRDFKTAVCQATVTHNLKKPSSAAA